MSELQQALLGLDDVMWKSLRVCAYRLDPAVSAADFADELQTLLERTYQAGYAAGRQACQRPTEAPEPAETDARGDEDEAEERPNAIQEAMRALRAAEAKREDGDAEPAPIRTPPLVPERPGRKLTHDDKVRIRLKYDAAVEGNGGCAPHRFVQSLAAQYGVTTQTIHNVVRGD